MSIRIRSIQGVRVALCAARSIEKPGDVYLDDGDHQALSEKFRRDFTEEGVVGCAPCYPEETRLAEAEESNNPNRESWDRIYGQEPVDAARKA